VLKSPALWRGFLLNRRGVTYLLRPEPDPVGVRVEPLGEPVGASVLPDGFIVLLDPVVLPTDGAGALPTEDPPADEPAPEVPPAAVPPLVDPPDIPPLAPPLVCANANVLESASAPANAIVMSFMVFSLLMMRGKPIQAMDVPR
jgi:hypothetical protein